jgi:truncated hemoglobin YjbI
MPYLPHDPSIYIDADIVLDLTTSFSDHLRRDKELAPFLRDAIGNQWEGFEKGFSAILEAISLQTGGHEEMVELAAPSFRNLKPDTVRLLLDVFLDACLETLPLHAAAAFAELANAAAEVVLKAIESDEGHLDDRLIAAKYALTVGNVLR